MLCSICINTYKRPELLKKLLLSLIAQKLDDKINIEIIVVDNDVEQQGQKVVEVLAKSSPFSIKYFTQPIKNIAITRNKAIKEAVGEYIFFIDDDEYADPYWIETNLSCLKKYNADGVFGVVRSHFDSNIPAWIKNNKMFHREIQQTGSSPNYTRTGNCLIKKGVINSIEGPFDLKYGVTGGSDSHLFNLLYNNGAKFVFCSESIVYEYVPPERANLKWLLKRSLRTGNSYARRTIELSSFKLLTKSYILLKAVSLTLINAIALILSLFSRRISSNYSIKIYGYFGHILAVFNIHYQEYK